MSTTPASETGTLYLVGTPIGNLGDMTVRALETLRAVDLIAAEDTRNTQKLLNHFAIARPLVSYHEHNERASGARLIERLLAGERVALVSDAGMPGISDPGEVIVKAAIENGIPVVPVPGPSAFVAALVGSGLATERFVFEAFLPREPKLRRRRLRELTGETRTLVFYEAPHRLSDTLIDMRGVWGDARRAVVARELTKLYEEFRRGTLAELTAHFEANPPRGEIVLVVEGGSAEAVVEGDWREALAAELAAGTKATEAAKAVSKRFGVSRQEAYDAALAAKPAKSN